jgi:hypothetical protein
VVVYTNCKSMLVYIQDTFAQKFLGRLTGVKACKTLWSTLECESTIVFVNDAVRTSDLK